MRFKAQDGTSYAAATPAGIADAMRADSHSPGRDRTEFMAQTAMRVRTQTGQSIRSAVASEFIQDLMHLGLLKPEPEADGDEAGK